jgi:hypothetical protein
MSDLIYHYTSADGLLGILKSNYLRMTNVKFLNDSRELIHGLDMFFNQVIYPIKQSFDGFDANNDPLLSVFEHKFLKIKESCPYFTTSFCKNADKLRQWTSYCPNGGYSIGFNRDYIDDTQEHITISDVSYNDINDHSLFASFYSDLSLLTEEFKEAIENNNPSILHGKWIQKIEEQANIISKLALFKKDKNFEDEEEVRASFECYPLKSEGHHKTDFYVKNNLILPFKKLFFEPRAIEEVVIGPMANQDLAENSLTALKEQFDFSISKSAIPLRML